MGRSTDEVLRDLMGLQEKIYHMFDEQTANARGQAEGVSPPWTPPVDIYETPESFVLLAEIPGVEQEEIDLEISDDLLVLRGERPLDRGDPDLRYQRVERPNGVFQRAFRLPSGIEAEAVRASYRDGVLRVTVPKQDRKKGTAVAVELED